MTDPLGTTIYLYDGERDNVIEEVDNSGTLLGRYNQEMGLDSQLSEFRSSTASYYEQDGINSVTSLSTSAGILANTYTYDAFGRLTASTGTLANPFQYTAREFDQETGVYEYRARYYDQTLGRFSSEDSMGFSAGLNFYAYASNGPLVNSDPTGLTSYQNFSATDQVAMINAVEEIKNKLKECPNCAGDRAGKILQALESATFVYDKTIVVKGKRKCGLTGGPDKVLHNIAHISGDAFDPSMCCPLPAVVFHETVHLTRWNEWLNVWPGEDAAEKDAYDLEQKCFGCSYSKP